MKILHTADWHIGHRLCKRERYAEVESFLHWLAGLIATEEVDILLVAGDVFDTCAPTSRAQELYYRFLWQVACSSCRHVVIIGGNHDSPSFLSAPKELLRHLDVHVVAAPLPSHKEEVLLLKGKEGQVEMIVCAVPYLRDRDIRTAEPGETLEDKDKKLIQGIRSHYSAVYAAANEARESLGYWAPLVAMGHLFAAGGKEGEGVRDLYVGTLGHVPGDIFPEAIDYIALGHLHKPQAVGGRAVCRYSGAPIPLGFDEASSQKSVSLVTLAEGTPPEISLVPVPKTRHLESIQGSLAQILARLHALASEKGAAWVEVIHTGKEIVGNFVQEIEAAVAGTEIELLRIKHREIEARPLAGAEGGETLDDLDPYEVFTRYLDLHEVPSEQHSDLVSTYREIVAIHQQEGG